MPGFEVTEISPWIEDGKLWHGLRARFPNGIASDADSVFLDVASMLVLYCNYKTQEVTSR